MASVELRELHRRFGDVVALDGIDLDIASGEFVSFLGPSGCGKTTALRLIAGFDRPTSGRVFVGGKDITGVAPNKRDIGMVFQAYSLFPNMTAVKNVEFGLRVRRQGRGDRRTRALELLELVGLGQAADRYPHQLSGGMQQRVALARALAIEPRLLCSTSRSRRSTQRSGSSSGGDPPHPDASRDHDDLRHARPGGGAVDLRPGGGAVARADRADRDAGRDLRRAVDAVRRRVRRNDESHRVDGGGPRDGTRRLRREHAHGRRRPRAGARRARAGARAAGNRRGGGIRARRRTASRARWSRRRSSAR